MAYRTKILDRKRIAGCLAALLILGMSGCAANRCGTVGCASANCRPLLHVMTGGKSCWCPNSICHGFRATAWHPWPVECVGPEHVIEYEIEGQPSLPYGEPIPAPNGYQQPLSPPTATPRTFPPQASRPIIGPSGPNDLQIRSVTDAAGPQPGMQYSNRAVADSQFSSGRPIISTVVPTGYDNHPAGILENSVAHPQVVSPIHGTEAGVGDVQPCGCLQHLPQL